MSDAEFWNLTPRLFFCLVEHRREREEAMERRRLMRAGTIAAAVYNAAGAKRPLSWRDIFAVEDEEREQTPDEMRAVLRRMAANFPTDQPSEQDGA